MLGLHIQKPYYQTVLDLADQPQRQTVDLQKACWD